MTTNNIDLTQYRQDAQGRLIPLSLIKPVDQERDTLVIALVRRAKMLSDHLRRYRDQAHADIEAFAALSAEQYGANVGGSKGNITLTSFDGRYKVVRNINEMMVFDERLRAAKALIDECLQEWSAGSKVELQAIVADTFQVNRQGRINVSRILTLRSHKIDHPKWQRAMAAISDSLTVASTRAYIRIYERDAGGNYQAINLDLANANAVAVAAPAEESAGEEAQG